METPSPKEKKILKIETKTVHILKYILDKDPNGEKRKYHTIEVFNEDGRIIDERSIYDVGEDFLRKTFSYELDEKGREIKRIEKNGYTTKEYAEDKVSIERIFKGHRRHLIEKKVYSYPDDNTINIVRWSNENKIIGKQVNIVENGRIVKISDYSSNDSLVSYSIYELDENNGVIREEILYENFDYPVVYEYDIEYDKFGNYIHRTRKQNGEEDGYTEQRIIYYEDTIIPEYSTFDFIGQWVSEGLKDTLLIDTTRMENLFDWAGRINGEWEYDQVENMIKVTTDRNKRYKRFFRYYFKLSEDELHLSRYGNPPKKMRVYFRI